jgi:glycosyltransferase involved in cell wall biosynthesis
MDILFISHNFNFEGAPKLLYRIVAELARDWDVAVLGHRAGELERYYASIDVPVFIVPDAAMPVPHSSGFTKEIDSVLSWMLSRSGRPRLIVFNTVDCVWGGGMAMKLGVPYLGIIHESIDPFWYVYHKNCEGWLYFDLLARAEATIYVAEATRELYRPFLRGARSYVIPNGIDVQELDRKARKISRKKAREIVGASPSEVVVLQVGTFCTRKGQAVTMRAAKRIWCERPELCLRFVFVGGRRSCEDEERVADSMAEIARRAGKLSGVVFVPETDKVEEYLKGGDIFVFPSLNESFPLATLEAMAFRLPIVASGIYGLKEQIEEGYNGFLIAPTDSDMLAKRIVTLAENRAVRKRMGEAGRHRLEQRYRASAMLERYKEILASYLA